MRIAIVGGGIAGLTSALALADAGFRPIVYEAARQLRPLGVGINLLPHAVRELSEMGLLDELLRIGVAIEALTYQTEDGREVWTEPRGIAAGYNWPQIAIHRGAFQLFLLEKVRRRLGEDAVRTDWTLEGLDPRDHAVVARFRHRERVTATAVEADVLIGADGIHSTVRRHFYPVEGRPKWNGVSLFRSTTRVSARSAAARMLWIGHADQKFIAYPIGYEGDAALLNWVCDLRTDAPGANPPEDWNRIADKELVLSKFAGWKWNGVDVSAILGAGGDVHEYPMLDRDPLPRWSFGRVTLAGDAAHPMYPIGSNGATQGIIDARVLALHLATAPDPAEGLHRYEALRREPTSRIVRANRAQGPDVVLEIARQRAADPGVKMHDAIPWAERARIAADYKRLAGFDPASLNARGSYAVPER